MKYSVMLEVKKRVLALKMQIADYKSKIKHCANDVVKNVYERELRNLMTMVGDSGEDMFSEDDVKSMSQVAREADSGVRDSYKASISNRITAGFF